MNKGFTWLALAVAISGFSDVSAETVPASCSNSCGYYGGLEAQWRHQNFQLGAGKSLFSHSYPQGNAFIGIRWNDYLGFEAGYESAALQKRTVLLPAGQQELGAARPSQSHNWFTSSARFRGPHASLVAAWPFSREKRLTAIGLVGVSRVRAKLERVTDTLHFEDFDYVPASSNIPFNPNNHFFKKKFLLRLGLGAEHLLHEGYDLGVRGTVIWEGARQLILKEHILPADGSSPLRIQGENALAYSLGFFLRF